MFYIFAHGYVDCQGEKRFSANLCKSRETIHSPMSRVRLSIFFVSRPLCIAMTKRMVWFPAIALSLSAYAIGADAQSAASARGNVTDPSGAVIPAASVQFSGSAAAQSVNTNGMGKRLCRSAGRYLRRAMER